jgi:hypothetical protein
LRYQLSLQGHGRELAGRDRRELRYDLLVFCGRGSKHPGEVVSCVYVIRGGEGEEVGYQLAVVDIRHVDGAHLLKCLFSTVKRQMG